MNHKHILITGGAGYIGPVIIRRLLNNGYKVTCLDLLLYQNQRTVLQFMSNSNFNFIFGDIASEKTMEIALRGVTDVILLAGLVGDPITKRYPKEAEAINVLGVQKCIKTLNNRGIKRVIFVSTCSNYGMSEGISTESTPLKPLSSYASAKVSAEEILLGSAGGVDYSPVVLRFATAFGLAQRMRFDLTINEFTQMLATGQELTVFDPDTWRPYCHVEDFARLVELILSIDESKIAFQVFNAGSDQNNFTKRMIVELLRQKIRGCKIIYQEHGTDPRNYRVDFSKVKNAIGFEAVHSVESGIDAILVAINQNLFPNVSLSNEFGNYNVNYNL